MTHADKPVKSHSTEKAIFSGGCFWCVEVAFEGLPGVSSVVSGYTGGHTKNPTYEQVSGEGTGHKESVEVTFDPSKITYDELLETYWKNIDPFDAAGQFCDKGDSYKAFIFYTNETQKKKAEESKKKVEALLKKPVVTEIEAASTFYPAEEYHQKYAQKNPIRYKFYRYSCGRDKRLQQVWGK
ncbi:MAG TPA: peptide-methionine (S)-S-oxide reductase MsrA [Alphaproteobacteria bacterium]|nr:peptide-methionine (S)-S-oxide reductase MsrA [Alphaproteobacteria bacterium]